MEDRKAQPNAVQNDVVRSEYSCEDACFEWWITEMILKNAKRYENNHEINEFSRKPTKRSYETEQILGRFLISISKNLRIYSSLDRDDEAVKKMESEFVEVNGTTSLVAAELTSKIVNIINTNQQTPTDMTVSFVSSGGFTVAKCISQLTGSYAIYIPKDGIYEKIKDFTSSKKEAMKILVRYQALISCGQHWSLPEYHYDYIRGVYGVTIEAFASPLNSKMMGREGCNYCSLFLDDPCSLGRFEEAIASITNKNLCVNPPFIEETLKKTMEIIEEYLTRSSSETLVFLVMPRWMDSEGWKLAMNSKFLIGYANLGYLDYHFEDTKGQTIQPRSSITYFILGSCSMTDEQIQEIVGTLKL